MIPWYGGDLVKIQIEAWISISVGVSKCQANRCQLRFVVLPDELIVFFPLRGSCPFSSRVSAVCGRHRHGMEGLVLCLDAADFFTADVGFYASFPFWLVVMH